MNVLFLCKRQYMRRDVLRDRYGRLYQIPVQLAATGARIHAVLASYRVGLPHGDASNDDGVHWESHTLPVSLPAYLRAVTRAAKEADVVIASSDCFHVALGGVLKRKYGVPLVLDLYDNYESFGMSKWPFLGKAYLRGLREADLVCCNGRMLAQYVAERAPGVDTLVLHSTIEANTFSPRMRESSRSALGLDPDRKLVGAAGGLSANRGIGFVYEACRRLNRKGYSVDLVLAGGRDRHWPIPTDPWVKDLGDLPHGVMVDFYNAMDVNVIQVRDDQFGHYCFPQKAHEILATQSPFIASNVGELARVLGQHPEILFDSEDVEQIEAAIRTQIESPSTVSVSIETWPDSINRLYGRLESLDRERHSRSADHV